MRCPTLSELPAPPPGKTGWPWTEESCPLLERRPFGDPWPQISIVTPSFNQGEFIEETIRSVLLQGYPNLEYIVIDGGSNDDSVQIIRKYEFWLTYWTSEKDRGQADAINKGFARATGAVLGFLNSDDVYWSGGLVSLIDSSLRVKTSKKVLLSGLVQDFDAVGLGKVFPNDRFGSIQDWLDGHVAIHQPGCFWSRDAWECCGPFREELHYVFDRYFFTTCRIKGVRLLPVGCLLAGFRLHRDSKTTRYQYEMDLFTPEWIRVRPDLERQLSLQQSSSVWFARQKEENWRLVSAALGGEGAESGARSLLAKVCRNPLWMLHRPVAGALLRLSTQRIVATFK